MHTIASYFKDKHLECKFVIEALYQVGDIAAIAGTFNGSGICLALTEALEDIYEDDHNLHPNGYFYMEAIEEFYNMMPFTVYQGKEFNHPYMIDEECCETMTFEEQVNLRLTAIAFMITHLEDYIYG